jgi:outer membrane protein OmpA-like peptidoglycan-associated protein
MSLESIFGQSVDEQNQDIRFFAPEILLIILLLALIIIFILGAINSYWRFSSQHSPVIEQTMTAQPSRLVLNTVNSAISVVQLPLPAIPTALKPLKPVAKSPSLYDKLYQDLKTEFETDFSLWQAEIDPTTLTIRFLKLQILFDVGEVGLNNHYQSVLADFFPRYLKILKKYQMAIKALQIEGHTSAEWRGTDSENKAYLRNMVLSQKRTFAVLEYCFWLPAIEADRQWLRQILITNGLSSSQPIFKEGYEQIELSRRVEFSISFNGEWLIKNGE